MWMVVLSVRACVCNPCIISITTRYIEMRPFLTYQGPYGDDHNWIWCKSVGPFRVQKGPYHLIPDYLDNHTRYRDAILCDLSGTFLHVENVALHWLRFLYTTDFQTLFISNILQCGASKLCLVWCLHLKKEISARREWLLVVFHSIDAS